MFWKTRPLDRIDDNLFLIFEDRSWTYAQFFADLQRVGNWLMKDLGVQKEEMVALNGGNTPEYLLLWFALDGIGSCVAFINNNLTANALIHSIKLSGARYMITDVENKNNTEPHETELETDKVKTIYYSQKSIDNLTDTTPLPQSRRSGIKPDAMRTLIYTSGTVSHFSVSSDTAIPLYRDTILAGTISRIGTNVLSRRAIRKVPSCSLGGS